MSTLIEKLDGYHQSLYERWYDNYKHSYDEGAMDAVENAIAIVKQHSDWISVDERLPADNEEVLTYWSDGDVVIAYFMKGRFSFSDCSGEIITHWQPLPQPPSEVQP